MEVSLMAKDILNIASSIKNLYSKIIQKNDLTEMKIHKLLYFSQKKHYENFGEWLFNDDFEGWRLGPVNKKVRSSYPTFPTGSELSLDEEYTIRETIFEYGIYSAEELSELSHSENAYKIARKGLNQYDRGDRTINKDDIINDILTKDTDYYFDCEVQFD
jgi:uncharacterized phage-associated protein